MNLSIKTLSLFVAVASVTLVQLTHAVTIPTIPIGNSGNPADTRYDASGFGSVAYSYRIGKYEVTNAQYAEFLNAVAATDTYGLYSTGMGSDTRGGIVRSGSSGSFTYAVKTPALNGTYIYDDKPVVIVNWFRAIRFANWLHNGQGGPGTTEYGAYTLLGGTPVPSNLDSITRNPGARWFLPSEDEWYKAAYHKNDGVTGNYWDYPTGTNSALNNNPPANDTGTSANYLALTFTTSNVSFPMTDAGAYTLSGSAYGTFDQGGNVREWNETLITNSERGLRGGSFVDRSNILRASSYGNFTLPTFQYDSFGFRVATIPELPGDFNHNGTVDAADVAQWQGDFGLNGESDADNDGDSDGADFLAWQQQFDGGSGVFPASAAIPEPSALILAGLAALTLLASRRVCK